MKVTLAGYNIEHELVQKLKRSSRTLPTPETISAAYARISRSTESAEELRRDARKEIARARRSNRTIVFEMGHHSIAEHAVFNFDVTGISRLAAEEIEHHRMNAYTEKSQRYVTLSGEHTAPGEFAGSTLADDFVDIIRTQNRYYHLLVERLQEYLRGKHADLAEDPAALENAAKEDARYITCLATQTQLGMTVNARTLELMIRRFSASELAEVRDLGHELHKQASAVAPSLLVFTGATDFEKNTYPRVREYAREFMTPAFPRRPKNFIVYSASDVSLVDYTQNADNKLIAAIMHTCSRASYAECLNRVERQTIARKKEILKLACQDLQAYDAVLREFEHLFVTFELVISASCFAQLKRHRLASVTCQPYNPNVGWTIPESVAEVKEHKNFKAILARTEEVYEKLREQNPAAAQYVLTNAHQRRVLVTLNARELHHVARLREDMAAQWDIRNAVNRMVEQARHVMPLTLLLAAGKDNYPRVYQELFGHPPAVTNLELPEARELDPEPRTRKASRKARKPAGKKAVKKRRATSKTAPKKKTTRKKKAPAGKKKPAAKRKRK